MLIGFFGKTFFATLMAYDFSLQEGETIQTVKMGGGGVRTGKTNKKSCTAEIGNLWNNK